MVNCDAHAKIGGGGKPDKGDVHAKPSMFTTALEAHECSIGYCRPLRVLAVAVDADLWIVGYNMSTYCHCTLIGEILDNAKVLVDNSDFPDRGRHLVVRSTLQISQYPQRISVGHGVELRVVDMRRGSAVPRLNRGVLPPGCIGSHFNVIVSPLEAVSYDQPEGIGKSHCPALRSNISACQSPGRMCSLVPSRFYYEFISLPE